MACRACESPALQCTLLPMRRDDCHHRGCCMTHDLDHWRDRVLSFQSDTRYRCFTVTRYRCVCSPTRHGIALRKQKACKHIYCTRRVTDVARSSSSIELVSGSFKTLLQGTTSAPVSACSPLSTNEPRKEFYTPCR